MPTYQRLTFAELLAAKVRHNLHLWSNFFAPCRTPRLTQASLTTYTTL